MFGQTLFPSASDLTGMVGGSGKRIKKDTLENSTVTRPIIGEIKNQDVSKYAIQTAVALTAIGTILFFGRNQLFSLNNQQFPS
ncbi:MAG: hypothetical protein VXX85_03865 [Candidatus Margulisiibacteriota bacterium]|nr:hypothetical protein [Candidatus Margulisiibacteriota bacterium]